MEEAKKIEELENNILNEKAVLKNTAVKSQPQSQNKIVSWFKDPYNLALVGVIIFAIVLRFFYFWLTKTQPLWWDESEYMAQAKSIAGLVHYDAASIRSPIFPAFMSLFFFLRIASEPIMRFFGLFIPSILVIVLTYFMVKEMYPDKRIALISTAIMAVLWEHLFYSNRFHTENIALIFQFLAIFIFFKVYMKQQNLYFIKPKYSLIWVLVLSIISFLFRPGNIMFLPALVLFLIILNKDKLFNKTGLVSISVIVLAVIVSFFISDMPMALLKQYTHFSDPLGWNSLTVFYGFYQSFIPNLPAILFYAFLIGLAIVLFKTSLILDRIKTLRADSENLEFKSNLFNIILLLCVLFIFLFIMRANGFEYRWFFPLLPAMLAFTAKGVIDFSEYIASLFSKKSIAIILIVIICLLGVYTQVDHADKIIKMKVDSYSQVKDAGIWLGENYPKNTSVLSISYPQTVYYSELNVSTYSGISNESAFSEYVKKTRAKLIEVSVFESHPAWMNNWLAENQDNLTAVKVYFEDESRKNTVLIVYEMNSA
jgi:hypothetical protein